MVTETEAFGVFKMYVLTVDDYALVSGGQEEATELPEIVVTGEKRSWWDRFTDWVSDKVLWISGSNGAQGEVGYGLGTGDIYVGGGVGAPGPGVSIDDAASSEGLNVGLDSVTWRVNASGELEAFFSDINSTIGFHNYGSDGDTDIRFGVNPAVIGPGGNNGGEDAATVQ